MINLTENDPSFTIILHPGVTHSDILMPPPPPPPLLPLPQVPSSPKPQCLDRVWLSGPKRGVAWGEVCLEEPRRLTWEVCEAVCVCVCVCCVVCVCVCVCVWVCVCVVSACVCVCVCSILFPIEITLRWRLVVTFCSSWDAFSNALWSGVLTEIEVTFMVLLLKFGRCYKAEICTVPVCVCKLCL